MCCECAIMAQLRKMCTEPCVIRARDVGKGTNVCDNWRHDRCSTKKQATAWPTMLLPLPSKAEEVRIKCCAPTLPLAKAKAAPGGSKDLCIAKI